MDFGGWRTWVRVLSQPVLSHEQEAEPLNEAYVITLITWLCFKASVISCPTKLSRVPPLAPRAPATHLPGWIMPILFSCQLLFAQLILSPEVSGRTAVQESRQPC